VPLFVTRSVFSPQYRRLCDALARARRARDVTQTQLATSLGRPQSFVSKYEAGERRLDFIEVLDIAACLELDPCDLVRVVRGD
jgi:transcriptional regulator with XRE-family HTH domain